VRINSPGGSASASDRIHHAVRRCIEEKPVVALFDSVAASGGYYIGCAANEVLVHRTTITGSIGVFAVMPDASAALGLLGIGHHAVGTGPLAGLDDPLAPFDAARRRALERVIAAVDRRFHQVVSDSRNLPLERVEPLAGGRVWTGEEAVANGLADGFGTLAIAVAHARARAGAEEPLPIERLPRQHGLLSRLGFSQTRAGLLPARLRLWAEAARRRAPTVMAWSNLRP
jgi:protease-4